jgi:hypothetical protein
MSKEISSRFTRSTLWIKDTKNCKMPLVIITKQTVADKIGAYLHHAITLAELVDWAERAIIDGELDERNTSLLAKVIGRLGLADVRAFGLTWEDCESLLKDLGYSARVDIVAA